VPSNVVIGGCYDAVMWRPYRLYPARLLTAPEARVIGRSSGRSLVAIDGLVCGVCAARTGRALARMRGVAAVEVDLARGVATIEHARAAADDAAVDDAAPDVAALDVAALERALQGVVVAARLRRRLAGWAARLRLGGRRSGLRGGQRSAG